MEILIVVSWIGVGKMSAANYRTRKNLKYFNPLTYDGKNQSF